MFLLQQVDSLGDGQSYVLSVSPDDVLRMRLGQRQYFPPGSAHLFPFGPVCLLVCMYVKTASFHQWMNPVLLINWQEGMAVCINALFI